jgi:cholesterol transport system auxiliary component
MSLPRFTARAPILVLLASLTLGGCITLFPKAIPAQLYRFGAQTQAAAAQTPTPGAPFNLQRGQTQFARAAQSDAILTSNGAETAYLADSRWVAPAVILFDEAVDQAFDASGGPARRTPRGEAGVGGVTLRLDVQTFEARYPGSKDAAPTVVVRVRALLARTSDARVLADRTFDVQKPADENRVGAIVKAFDAAARDAIGQIVAWTEVQGTAMTPSP